MRSRKHWSDILCENVAFTLPITPFRFFRKKDIKDGRRSLIGIDAVMADAASIRLMTECVGQGTTDWKEGAKR